LTLDRVEVTLMRICGRGLPTHQIRWKSEKLFVDGRADVWTDGRTHLSSNLLGHRRGDDLIKIVKQQYLLHEASALMATSPRKEERKKEISPPHVLIIW